MTRLEKIAAKKSLIEGLKAKMNTGKESVKSFLTSEKHKTKRRIAAGVAGAGVTAAVLRKLLKKKSKGSLKSLLKSNKGKVVAGATAGVGLGALLSKNKG